MTQEIEVMRRLKHKNIVNFITVFEHPDYIAIVMECLEGHSLAQIIKSGKIFLDDSKILEIIKECLNGLSYLHSLKFIHRDIKPSNIMIKFNEIDEISSIKLVDFGLIGNLNSEENKVLLEDRCGTVGYLAPELIRKEEKEVNYDQKVDIYSLGIILFQMYIDI